MRTSRRDLIRLGAVAAVSCFAPGRASAGGSRPEVTPLEAGRQAILDEETLLTRTVMTGQIDTEFLVEGEPGDVRAGRLPSLWLRNVTDLPSAKTTGTGGFDLCFSALFTGPASNPLRQQTYRLQHAALGTFSVFLVPVGRPGREVSYEATFNRLEA